MSTPQPPAPDDSKRSGEIVSVEARYSGPLPHPAVLSQYREIQPDFPERIMRMAESQLRHDQEIEKTQQQAAIKSERRGAYFALIISLGVLALGGYLIVTGQPVAGLVALVAPLTGFVGVFVVGRLRKRGQQSAATAPNA